jgi:hypothetical protein
MKNARKKSCIALSLFLALILFSNFIGEKNTSAVSPQDAQTFKITSTSGENITLAVTGNVSASQITDFFFMNLPDWYNNTNINFNLNKLNGSTAFMNMTVPKNAILGGTQPVISINGGLSRNNGFTQDSENFYVWFTAQSPQWDDGNRSQVSVGFLLVPNHKAISFSRQTFIVPALVTQTVNVALGQGETLSGSVHLSYSAQKEFNFEVIDPNGHSIVQYENVNSKMWKFIAEMNGIYTLTIVNPSFSTIDSVTLEYSVSNNVPSNYGVASLNLLVVFGVVIAVGIGLVVVFLTIRSKPKASHKVLYS